MSFEFKFFGYFDSWAIISLQVAIKCMLVTHFLPLTYLYEFTDFVSFVFGVKCNFTPFPRVLWNLEVAMGPIAAIFVSRPVM